MHEKEVKINPPCSLALCFTLLSTTPCVLAHHASGMVGAEGGVRVSVVRIIQWALVCASCCMCFWASRSLFAFWLRVAVPVLLASSYGLLRCRYNC